MPVNVMRTIDIACIVIFYSASYSLSRQGTCFIELVFDDLMAESHACSRVV